jgi:regulator of nucleoside diphosphate kinase
MVIDPHLSDDARKNMMSEREIVVTEFDRNRLRNLLEGVRRGNARDRAHVDDLEAELDRADVVLPVDIPFDVVTMNSEVTVRDMDSNEEMTFAVVFPSDADIDRQRISILAPIGTAVFGYRAGDTIDWKVPGRTRRLKIERLLFQPEAAGQFDR